MTAPDYAAVALRALSFIAVFQAAGVPLFLSMLGPGLAASAKPAARLGINAAWAGIVTTALYHFVQPARLLGTFGGVLDGGMQAVVLASDAGTAHAVRVAGLALIIAGLGGSSRPREAAGIIGSTLVVASFTFMGHTAGSDLRWLLALLLFAHLAVAAFWFGSLIPLHMAIVREAAPTSGAVVQRFSALAVRLVPSILVAGVVLAAILMPTLASLVTPYGVVVMGKAAAFAALMLLAAANKWRWGPRIASSEGAAITSFGRSVLSEWVIIAAVLMATAVMTTLFSPAPPAP